jgi:sulfite reductase (NADPH) flavoprotein alpha-component
LALAAVPKTIRYESGPPVSRVALSQLASAVAGFDREQLLWSSGYLAGLAERSAHAIAEGSTAQRAEQTVSASSELICTVFYATETGHSRRLAEQYIANAESRGVLLE